MTVWRGMSGGARLAGAAAGIGVVAVLVGLLWPMPAPETPPADPTPAAVATDPEAGITVEPEPEPEAAPVAEAEAEVQAAEPENVAESEAPVVAAESVLPSFDSYRVEADGSAVVSGRAEPLAVVTVLVDGLAVAEVRAGGDGNFAALFTLPPNALPSLMTLEAVLADGRRLASAQSVALAPIVGPVVVADVPPEVSAEPDATPEAGVAAEADVPVETETAAVEAVEPDPAPPVSLLVTEEGATVVHAPVAEAADPAEVTPVLLEAISYSPAGAVQLSGKGEAGQVARIYLDNDPVAEAVIAATGLWQVTLGDTAPGIYTLRVDQIDDAGQVTARFETPFKRETLEALAALSGTAPSAPETTPPEADLPLAQAGTAPDDSAVTADAEVSEPEAEAETVAEATTPAPEPAPVAEATVATPPVPADPAPPAVAAAPEAAPVAPEAAPPPAPVVADAPAAPVAPPPLVTVTVQPGFTLWGIARENFGEGVMYVQVYEANRDKIRNPDLIYPGQVFTIPAKP